MIVKSQKGKKKKFKSLCLDKNQPMGHKRAQLGKKSTQQHPRYSNFGLVRTAISFWMSRVTIPSSCTGLVVFIHYMLLNTHAINIQFSPHRLLPLTTDDIHIHLDRTRSPLMLISCGSFCANTLSILRQSAMCTSHIAVVLE